LVYFLNLFGKASRRKKDHSTQSQTKGNITMQTNQSEMNTGEKTEKTEKKGKRRIGLLAIGFGIMGTGGILASAASLGISQAGSIGTGVQVISTCDNDGVILNYTSGFSTTTGKYEVTGVDITGINVACYGRNLKITLRSPNPAGGYFNLATASRGLEEVDPITSVFTGHTALELNIDPAYDSTTMDSAAIVIA
jgi:hypothetical protein